MGNAEVRGNVAGAIVDDTIRAVAPLASPRSQFPGARERRLRRLASYGITTVEVKSGYGLSVVDEIKTLRVIQRLAARVPMRIIATFLGAHEVPLDHRQSAADRSAYIQLVIHEMLPVVGR